MCLRTSLPARSCPSFSTMATPKQIHCRSRSFWRRRWGPPSEGPAWRGDDGAPREGAPRTEPGKAAEGPRREEGPAQGSDHRSPASPQIPQPGAPLPGVRHGGQRRLSQVLRVHQEPSAHAGRRLDSYLRAPLEHELVREPQLGESRRRFLDGDQLTLADCRLLPKLHIVDTVCAHFRGAPIPAELRGVRRYLDSALQVKEFKYTCPHSAEILAAYRTAVRPR
ncbi:chloride intracellular channel protein 3 isoform X3 [Prionailurus viverrinus]|nr:chloride intracellular channel protein 3 isoform X3 [Prionailurus viverrinus]